MSSEPLAILPGDTVALDDQGGFTMEFHVDILEDIEQEVENAMILCTRGAFDEARDVARETMEPRLDSFPVLAEFLRLLYDQGDFIALKENVEAALGKPTKMSDPYYWNAEHTDILILLKHLCRVHTSGYSPDAFRGIPPFDDMLSRIPSTSLDDLSEENLFAIVLMLNLRYLEHQRTIPLPNEMFLFWPTENPDQDLCPLLIHMLQTERYWAAENVLKVCFRRSSSMHYTINYQRIWDATEWYAAKVHPSDLEVELWARAALLQTFCEGLLYSQCPSLRLGDQISPWVLAIDLLARIQQLLEERSPTENVWRRSRCFRRQRLIVLDKKIFDKCQLEETGTDYGDVQVLKSLKENAEAQHDHSILRGIAWRLRVIADGMRPVEKTMPGTTIPFQLYEQYWEKIIKDEGYWGG